MSTSEVTVDMLLAKIGDLTIRLDIASQATAIASARAAAAESRVKELEAQSLEGKPEERT